MSRTSPHHELHRNHHQAWLRAAVLGANDGIISTASLIIGVAAAGNSHGVIMMTGVAALVAGAMSMAAGEYISVSSQADSEHADLTREQYELGTEAAAELEELTHIYVQRGLDLTLASQVAIALTKHDAIGAHARDELGIQPASQAKPIQAALSSALSFAIGAGLPLIIAQLTPIAKINGVLSIGSLLLLGLLGMVAASIGGANKWLGALRVSCWGALAMLATWGVGQLLGVTLA